MLPHWLKEVTPIPDYRLTEVQRAHLELARRIAQDYPGVKGVGAAVLIHADSKIILAGLYIANRHELYISPDRLDSARTTVDTTIHELGHHMSQADDGSDEHLERMKSVARMVRDLALRGAYDTLLAGVRW